MIYKKIKLDKGIIEAICIKLINKNFILLRGKRGYIMCGYLNMATANKFSDLAIKVTGVSSIKEACESKVSDSSMQAKALGVYKGQPIKEVLKLIV